MNRVCALTALVLLPAIFGVAQAPSSDTGPSPEQQAMGYFAGDWTLDGTAKISPSSPASPFTAHEKSEWVSGGFFLETHTSSRGPLGALRSTRVMGYNPEDKTYTYNAYNSLGEHMIAIGNFQGNVWTWKSEAKMNGLVTSGRYTITITSPNTYTFRSEVAGPNASWSTVMEGKATRTPQ